MELKNYLLKNVTYGKYTICINDALYNEKELSFEIKDFKKEINVDFYLNSKIKFETGIYVAQISLDSPAFKSGLQIGDVITKIDNNELEKMCDLREYVYSKSVGEIVYLTVLRNNKEKTVEVKLSRK